MVIFSGCSINPKYAIQTATGLEVGISRDTNKVFKLIDENNRVVAKTKATEKILVFLLPAYTSPNICYAVIDDEGEPLFKENSGLKITSIYNYNQKIKQQANVKQQYDRRVKNETMYSNRVRTTEANLTNNKLFNGSTCNSPQQRPVPPFPKTICGSYTQCEKLATDSCMKNLVDAESCGVALSNTNVHGSITTMGCGALLSTLNGENYGIGTGVQDAITGYLDEHTKGKIRDGEYGEAFATGAIRIFFTYMRTQSCKEKFTKAAYAPIESWIATKNYIEREPEIARNKCNILIRNYNSSLEVFNDNESHKKDLKKKLISLSRVIKKEKSSSSATKVCRL